MKNEIKIMINILTLKNCMAELQELGLDTTKLAEFIKEIEVK